MRSSYIIIGVLIILMIPSITADQTVKTIEENKYYRNNLPSGTTDYFDINIAPPDKISEIQDFTFNVLGDVKINGDVELMIDKIGGPVNWKSCKPNEYTNFGADVYRYEMHFDCSNQINHVFNKDKALNFNVSIEAKDKNVRNVDVSYRMTYFNDPISSVSVFGTEYVGGENGTIFLQLLDTNGNPINDAFCDITMFNPDENKTKLFDDAPMTFLERGIYFRDLVVPKDPGVYMLDAHCAYSDIIFEFDQVDNVTFDGSLQAGSSDDPVNVRNTDCVFINIQSAQFMEFEFNDSEIGNINLSEITDLDLVWVGQHEETANLQIFNFTDSSWISVGNSFALSTLQECYSSQAVSRDVTSGFDDFVNGDAVRFRIFLDASGKKIFTDEASLIFHNNGSVIGDIRGSGEIHVGSVGAGSINLSTIAINGTEIAEDVWSFPVRNLTFYEDATNYSRIWSTPNRSLDDDLVSFIGGTEYHSGENGTILMQLIRGSNIVDDANCSVTLLFPNRTFFEVNQSMFQPPVKGGIYLHDFIVPTTEGLYPYGVACSKDGKTFFAANTFHVQDIDLRVWNFIDRNLTFYPTVNATTVNQVNATINVSEIWNFPNRSAEDSGDRGSAFIGGTEYQPNEEAKIALRLIRNPGSGNAAAETGASCNITILNPDETEFISSTGMSEFGQGIYTFDFNTSTPIGIYTYFADCSVGPRDYFALNTFHVTIFNESTIADNVWSFPTRNLTFYEDVTDYNLIQSVVWNASVRTLTDFNFTVETTINLTDINATDIAEAVWSFEGNISNNIITTLGDYTACVIESLLDLDEGWGVQITECLTN